MFYELREYYIAPGKEKDLDQRFSNVTLGLFEKYNIKVVGFWKDIKHREGKLVYLCQFESNVQRDNAWEQLKNDPYWIERKAESEVNGPLTTEIVSTFLEPTEYSELK